MPPKIQILPYEIGVCTRRLGPDFLEPTIDLVSSGYACAKRSAIFSQVPHGFVQFEQSQAVSVNGMLKISINSLRTEPPNEVRNVIWDLERKTPNPLHSIKRESKIMPEPFCAGPVIKKNGLQIFFDRLQR
jgi:hypothetical protein